MTSDTELLLMFAARAQHLQTLIQPNVTKGIWVLCDRFTDATYAYQGGGRGLMPLVKAISDASLHGFKPDLTLYLDIEPSLGLQRASQRGALDRIEKQHIAFFERARETFLQFAAQDSSIIVIDASQTMEKVHQDIRAQLSKRLSSAA